MTDQSDEIQVPEVSGGDASPLQMDQSRRLKVIV
jgi:hypothetical protein